jgi:8-oxo-dGTP pyrophosphatase MutT (NUDIX family)
MPRDAATVILVRPAAPSPGSSSPGAEVYMLRRRRSMAFAPGAYVFPGGSVDASDADEHPGGSPPDGWAFPGAAGLGRALDDAPEHARALARAAVRETFEECGVLLAGPSRGTVLGDMTGEGWDADRRALLDGSLTLARMLTRRGVALRADLLRPWARWVTPEPEERRFDTRFYVTELPVGQRTSAARGEADEEAWLRPASAVAAAEAGTMRLLAPTITTLRELAALGDVPAILSAGRQITPLRPRVVLAGRRGRREDPADDVRERAWLEIPGDASAARNRDGSR